MRDSDTSGHNKLERVTKYIHGTIVLTFVLSIENYVDLKWFVGASFAVHKYMIIHTGGFIIMVK